ncbi:MAG: M23 family metallopeptidase [Prolixibacteraceae bacterium]
MKAFFLLGLSGLPLLMAAQPFNSVSPIRFLHSVQIQNKDSGKAEPSVIGTERPSSSQTGKTITLAELEEIAFSFPLASLQITSPFGMRLHPMTNKNHFHAGVDLRAGSDTVRAILNGKVNRCGYDRNLGYFVRIRHGPYESLYGHLSRYFAKAGELVLTGQPIGVTGNTGRSTGVHLHFSILQDGKPVDPVRFLSGILHFNNQQKQIDSTYETTNFKTTMH